MEPTRGTSLLLGESREAATRVFGAAVDRVVTATYAEAGTALTAETGFVGVAAGAGQSEAVRAVLVSAAPGTVVAVEVPDDDTEATALAGVLGQARVTGVRAYAERTCLVLDPGAEAVSSYDAAWVSATLLAAGRHSPDTLHTQQARTSTEWEVAALRERSGVHERDALAAKQKAERLTSQLDHVIRGQDRLKKRLKEVHARYGIAEGDDDAAPPAASPAADPEATQALPPPGAPADRTVPLRPVAAGAKKRTLPPPAPAAGPSTADRARALVFALSGILGARGRQGRTITLATFAGAAVLLVVVIPVLFGLIGGTVGALVGIATALVVLAVGLVGVVLLSVVRRGAETPDADRLARKRHRALARDLQMVRERLGTQGRNLDRLAQQPSLTRTTMRDLVSDLDGQVQSAMNLRDLVTVNRPLPVMGRFTASADLLVVLLQEFLDLRPRTVVEAGSGISTLFLALAAEQHGVDATIVALEHHRGYAQQTRDLLARHGVSHRAEVRDAPLARTSIADHATPWYDESAIADLTEIGLVLVDGPPKSTGPSPRYPMIPLLVDKLSATCTILVDDTRRAEDAETVERWRPLLPDFRVEPLPLEKGAVALRRS